MLNPTTFFPIWMYTNWALTAMATLLFIYLALSKKLDFKLFQEPELITKNMLPTRAVVIPSENLGNITFEAINKKGNFMTETIKPEPEPKKRQESNLMPEEEIIASLKNSAPKQAEAASSSTKSHSAPAPPPTPQNSQHEALKLA